MLVCYCKIKYCVKYLSKSREKIRETLQDRSSIPFFVLKSRLCKPNYLTFIYVRLVKKKFGSRSLFVVTNLTDLRDLTKFKR